MDLKDRFNRGGIWKMSNIEYDLMQQENESMQKVIENQFLELAKYLSQKMDIVGFLKLNGIAVGTDLEEENRVLKKALELACVYTIDSNELYDKVSDFNVENERYSEDNFGIHTDDIYDYFIQQAKESEEDD